MGYARWRAVCAATLVAAGVTLGMAAPAAADVQVPGDYRQGDAAEMTFKVTNDNPATPLTGVELRLPAEWPIGEALPMSVDGWAPAQTMRTIDKPIISSHGGQITEVVATIRWTALPGSELKPGAGQDFRVSMFTLPLTGTFVVPVVTTFADGSVVNYTATPGSAPAAGERPALAVPLAPPAAVAEEPATDGADAATEPAGDGSSNMLWMFALLVLIGGITAFALLRQRRDERAAGDTTGEVGRKAAEDNDSARERASL